MMLALLRLLKLLRGLWDFPDIHDEPALRTWLRALVELAEELAKLTPITADDQIMKTLRVIVESDVAWKVVYELVIHFAGSDLPMAAEPSEEDVAPAVTALADPKINPVVIVQIVMAILEIIKFFRERKR